MTAPPASLAAALQDRETAWQVHPPITGAGHGTLTASVSPRVVTLGVPSPRIQ
jgi:hypothetical protein